MSFRSLPEKDQRELAQKHIEERDESILYDPYMDYSYMFGPPGLDEAGMIEWFKAQDDLDPHSVMESLAKEK